MLPIVIEFYLDAGSTETGAGGEILCPLQRDDGMRCRGIWACGQVNLGQDGTVGSQSKQGHVLGYAGIRPAE